MNVSVDDFSQSAGFCFSRRRRVMMNAFIRPAPARVPSMSKCGFSGVCPRCPGRGGRRCRLEALESHWHCRTVAGRMSRSTRSGPSPLFMTLRWINLVLGQIFLALSQIDLAPDQGDV
ncbi:MAG: hypothetical protein LBE06_02845 [Azoarcus sp.]|jgi:hypothetical protein|nr:hypothetical protein [Azoarcus sp.]